jgi:PhoH-like ATPase
MGKKKNEPKIFVLDTNVILHDHSCVYNFQENDVVIPITVIEELDKFKKGNEDLNYQSREFTRLLDRSDNSLFDGGLPMGPGKGKLRIEIEQAFSETLKSSFKEDIPDHRILATTEAVKEKNLDRKVVFVSKDINLRMKARSLGFEAQDYLNDKVKNLSSIQKGITIVENLEDEKISQFHTTKDHTMPALDFAPTPNEYFIFKGSKNSALVRYNGAHKSFELVEKKAAYAIKPRNAEQTFLLNALLNPEIKLIATTGKAGTGKTLLALAAALEQHKLYSQILLARPIVALSNRDLGFLPGDAMEKIAPYMQPLFDNLGVIKNNLAPRGTEYLKIEELQKEDKLLITPLAYIRGRSLSNTFFIVDEAQNLTPHEIKTIITRAGEGTKMVFTGDLKQIDSPYLDESSNGLAYVIDRMLGQSVFAKVHLVKGERSPLAELAADLL